MKMRSEGSNLLGAGAAILGGGALFITGENLGRAVLNRTVGQCPQDVRIPVTAEDIYDTVSEIKEAESHNFERPPKKGR